MFQRINKILFNDKKNLIWGIGENGKYLSLCFLHQNISIDLYCDSNPENQGMKLLNKKVISPEEALKDKDKYNFLISTGRDEDTEQIIEFLKENEVDNYITWKDLCNYIHVDIEFSLETLYKIIRDTKGKKVIVYGTDAKAWRLKNLLELLELSVAYMVNDIEKEQERNSIVVKPVYDLLEESLENIFVILTGNRDSKKAKILQKMGLQFYFNYNYIESYRDTSSYWILDPHLGHNYIIDNEEQPGIMKWESRNSDLIIATLGGSTTDGYQYNFKSWPQILHEILEKNGYRVSMINAGCGGYRSSQELIKLERDILPLKPHIVLNYTGFNDAWVWPNNYEKYPFVHMYQQDLIIDAASLINVFDDSKGNGYTFGIGHQLKKEDIFLQNVRMMNSICKEFETKYHCFLQPSLFLKKEYSMNEKELEWHGYNTVQKNSAKKFKEYINEKMNGYKYISDITWLFDDYNDVYLDVCHVTEEGNAIIAEYMYKFLIEKGWLSK